MGCGGSSVLEIVRRIEAGDLPSNGPGAMTPIDLIAALAAAALGDDDAKGPALVQEKPRRDRLVEKLSGPALAALFPGAAIRARLTLAAGLLQVHDFWDASHEAAQQADDLGERGCSAYWHGIAHRREPDAGNAAYWFRRVGRHPIYQPLAQAARPCLENDGLAPLAGQLIPDGAWNASAMIDLCTGAASGTPQERLARRLQKLEMWLLLEASVAAL